MLQLLRKLSAFDRGDAFGFETEPTEIDFKRLPAPNVLVPIYIENFEFSIVLFRHKGTHTPLQVVALSTGNITQTLFSCLATVSYSLT